MRVASYDLTIDDHVAGAREPVVRRAALKSATLGSPWKTVGGILFVTAIMTFGLALKGANGKPAEPWQIAIGARGALVAVTVGYLLIVILTTMMQPRLIGRMVAKGAFGQATGPHTVALREDGVQVTSPSGETKYHWSSFQRLERGTKGLMFFLGPARIVYIPLRAFTASGADEFLTEARRLHANSPPKPA